MDDASRRSRAIERRLRKVEGLPASIATSALPGSVDEEEPAEQAYRTSDVGQTV
jgi:hypothetical protein